MKRLNTKAAAAGKKAPSIMETDSVNATRPVPSQVFFRAFVIAQGIIPAANIRRPKTAISFAASSRGMKREIRGEASRIRNTPTQRPSTAA